MQRVVISGTGLFTPEQSISNDELVVAFNAYVLRYNAANAIWQRIEEAKKNGQKLEDDEDKMRKEYREIAERRVRLGLLLADVGRSNSIDVTPEELNQAVMREAMRYPGQERQVLEFYGKNAELKDQLRAPIFEEKTVDFILELAKVSEKSVTPEELLKAAREAEEEEAGEKAAD